MISLETHCDGFSADPDNHPPGVEHRMSEPTKPGKKIVAALVVIALIAVAGYGAWLLFDTQKNTPASMDPVVVAWSPYEAGALFWIAEDQDFFEKNGLNVTTRRYDSGAASLDAVVNGDVDLTMGVSEFPLVRMAFQNTDIRAIGNIDKGNFIYLVAGKDRIGNISDIRGKKVGTALGTVAEFHLGRFLTLNGMTTRDITLVDVRTPEGWVNDVADGSIDAIATAQPYADEAMERLGGNSVSWPIQSNQPVFGLIVATGDWTTRHPDLVVKFLDSLALAEKYAQENPAGARAIVQQRLNFDPGYMDTVWQRNQFSLTLDQSLVTAMEDEARWMIANNLTNATAVPDFGKFIYRDGLNAVKPGSLRIIG